MHRQLRYGVAGLVCALLALGSSGCNRDAETEATTSASTPAPTTAPAPLTVASVNLGKSIGADKRVTSETTQFSRTDTIYASVSTNGTGNGNVTARWTFQDGQVVDETTQPISATGPATTEFHISKPSGWPAGNYKVEVSLNGKVAQSKEFSVQ